MEILTHNYEATSADEAGMPAQAIFLDIVLSPPGPAPWAMDSDYGTTISILVKRSVGRLAHQSGKSNL